MATISGKTLAQVTAHRLMSQAITRTYAESDVQRHSSEGKFTMGGSAKHHWNKLEIYSLWIKSPTGYWVKTGSNLYHQIDLPNSHAHTHIAIPAVRHGISDLSVLETPWPTSSPMTYKFTRLGLLSQCRHTAHVNSASSLGIVSCDLSFSHFLINSWWSSHFMWRPRSRSTPVQATACCLRAPSRCPNQCWHFRPVTFF